jgi:hypothetical protein
MGLPSWLLEHPYHELGNLHVVLPYLKVGSCNDQFQEVHSSQLVEHSFHELGILR